MDGWVKDPDLSGELALNASGVTLGADGDLRTEQFAPQLLGGYNNFYDQLFGAATEAKPEFFPFSYQGTKYVIWAWKGEYLSWGDGDEVGMYAQNNRLLDHIEGWNADLFDPNLPKMSVSASVGGLNIGSFAPKQGFAWVGVWDPHETDTDLGHIDATATVTFRNAAMYHAFSQTYENSNVLTFNPKDHSATINF